MKKYKKFLMCIAAVFITANLCSCTHSEDSEEKPEKVVIATQTITNMESIAKAENYFQEEMNVNIELISFDSGREVSAAIERGEADLGMLGSAPAAIAVANNVQCRIIYIHDVLGSAESLIVNNASSIRSAEDLRGKNIATVFSSTAHYSLMKYLEVNNIDASEVNIIDLKASEMVNAYEKGEIDGAYIWSPQTSQMLARNGYALTDSGKLAESGYPTLDVEVVRTDFAEKYPFMVEKYISCVEKGVQLYRKDPDKACKSISKNIGIPVDHCYAQTISAKWLSINEQLNDGWFNKGILSDTLYTTADFLYSQGELSDKPDKQLFIDAVDSSYLNRAK